MRNLIQKLRPAAALALLTSAVLAKFAPQANAQTFDTVLSTNLFQPAGVSVNSLNQYVISDTANHRIVNFNADNRTFRVVAGADRAPFEAGAVDGQGIDARFRNPQGILCVGDKTYVADSGNHVIREIDANGNVRTIAGNLALAHEVDDFQGMPSNWGLTDGAAATAQFNGPSGLAADLNGHLYIADSGNHAIRMLDLNSHTVSTIVRLGLTTPVSVALAGNGALLISDAGVHSIKIWRPGDAKATLVAGGGTALARGFRNSSIAANALFNAPAGIYYREITDELIVADSGNGVLRTIQGVTGSAPKVDTFANTAAAGFTTPIAVTRDLYGVFLVCDSTKNTLASVITVKFPRIEKPQVGYIIIVIDNVTGIPQAKLAPVTDATFDNMVRVAISGDKSAQHYFTYNSSKGLDQVLELPTTNSSTAQNFEQPVEPVPKESELNAVSLNQSTPPQYSFHVKAFSAPKGVDERIPSLVTEAFFRFKCATPQIDSQSVPGRLVFTCNTTNSVIYYTVDGSDPRAPGTDSADDPGNGTKVRNEDSIPLVLGAEVLVVKARAYLNQGNLRFIPSDTARAEFNPDNFVPNRISLGFQDGEASSLMHASPGQRFFAPVTLSLMPSAKAYGLQFDLSLEPMNAPVSADYKMKFNSTFIEQTDFTNRIIPPSVFVLTGTNYVVSYSNYMTTNYTYEVTLTNLTSGPSTNYVTFTDKVKDVAEVVTTVFATNLGALYPVKITNYVTNSFPLVSQDVIATANIDIETNYLYRYISPSVTNFVERESEIPATSPVVITNFVSNMGQVYAYNITNYATNSFNLVSKGTVTRTNTTLDTNFAYRAVTPASTNFVTLDRQIDDATEVVITNFVANLGQLFPTTTTNRFTNLFELVSVTDTTNRTTLVTNIYTYRAVLPGTTNYVTWDRVLPDKTAVIVTNFVTNLGQAFPVTSTNYITNAFNLVSGAVVTNTTREFSTNFLYEAGTPSQTNFVVLDHVLKDNAEIITTNLVSNLGQLFPVLSTNRVTNSFNLVYSGYATNVEKDVLTNYLYEFSIPAHTNIVEVDHRLDDRAAILTTNLVQNLGQDFKVVTTNYVTNKFNFLSEEIVTNYVSTVTTNFDYQAVIPGTTNYITANSRLPDFLPIVLTNFVTNLGQLFPITSTNYIANGFNLVATTIETNRPLGTVTNFLYEAATPEQTTTVLLNRRLDDRTALLTTNFVANMGELFPVVVTNYVTNAFNLISYSVTTNSKAITSSNYLYEAAVPGRTSIVVLDHVLGDFTEIRTTNFVSNLGQQFPVVTTNIVNNQFNLLSTEKVTNTLTSISTNFQYRSITPATTNLVLLNGLLRDSIPVVSSNFIANMGTLYPVYRTNVVTNSFDLISAEINTNITSTVSTSIVYRFIQTGTSNYITLDHLLPDEGPVIFTADILNQGIIYHMSHTNLERNAFELVSAVVNSNVVNSLQYNYNYDSFSFENDLVWPTPLADFTTVIVTNMIVVTNTLAGNVLNYPVVTSYVVTSGDLIEYGRTDAGELTYKYRIPTVFPSGSLTSTNFPIGVPTNIAIRATGYVPTVNNTFSQEFVNTMPLFLSSTNTNSVLRTSVFSTNATYRIGTPSVTNYITLATNLPAIAPVVTVGQFTNQGQNFIMVTTNYVSNRFELVSTTLNTTSVTNVSTNAVYAFRTPAVTNIITLATNLPDLAPVVTTTFVTNLGQTFEAKTTNWVANTFEFLGEFRTTNVTPQAVTTNVTYAFVEPGVTKYVLWPEDLPPVGEIYTTNFISNLGRQFPVISTNYLTNTFRLVSDSFVTNFVDTKVTNVVYQFHTPGNTNYVVWPELLPDYDLVLTTNFISNLGRQFPVVTTNYVTNNFRILGSVVQTNFAPGLSTNWLYSLTTPTVTNFLSLTNELLNFAEVVTTTFITNQGQFFPVYTTNLVPNSFDFLGRRLVTNNAAIPRYVVTYAFFEPTITNYIVWPNLLPALAPVLTTNFVSNLGRQFPVISTNYVTNAFRLASSAYLITNENVTISTNIVYQFKSAGSTNYIISANRLPDVAPSVTTNFVSNLGQLFPVAVTNYLTNTFRLVSDSYVVANETSTVATNIVYVFSTPGVTNLVVLNEKLPASREIVTTNFISNLGQLYPVLNTNVVFNTFELISFGTVTNYSDPKIVAQWLYALKTPSITNIVFWAEKLPDTRALVSTNFITNLGGLFPVLTTNVVANTFQLLYTNYVRSEQVEVLPNVVYEFHTPIITNLFELNEKLEPFVQVITTNYVTNLNRLFPVYTTNTVVNMFELLSTNVIVDATTNYVTNFVYAVVLPGGGNGQPTITTNLLTLNSPMDAVLAVTNLVGYATNLNQLYPVYTTNYITNNFRLIVTALQTNEVKISSTNVPVAFNDLVITNSQQNWLAVGWIETYGRTNLYNTISHDLLMLSMAHTTTFESKKGESVAGTFSFIVPTNAVNGDQYKVRVSRPSATADGINQDMFIQAPDEDDTRSLVKAVKTLTVTNQIAYLVGDVSNFKWFNAGEFGDGNLLNNDMTELQRCIVYGLNVPFEDSDFLDAMDTCCFTEDGVDLSNIKFASTAIDLNQIAFGEGSRYAPFGRRPNATLAVNDLYVAYRRSLDTNLLWYARYWSNSTRQAMVVPNTFRGNLTNLMGRQSTRVSALASYPSSQDSALTIYAGTASGLPGKIVAVPVHARVEGGYPLRTLMFNVRVEGPDGTTIPSSSLEVAATDALGLPTVPVSSDSGRSGAAWLDTSVGGILGDQVVGRVLFTIPADAQPSTLYYVKIDRVSGSPNGVSLFPVRTGNGLVAMANRPASVWTDGIPDAWRMQYFGTLNDVRSAADVDADGDGLSNFEEYKLGTNPLDANDSLRVHASANGRGVTIRFHTESGRMYRIEGSNTLLPGSWNTVLSNVPGTGNDLELPAPGGDHNYYYRVLLQE